MPRPKNKSELIETSQANFDKLTNILDSLSPDQLQAEFPPTTLNRNVRDVVAHLHHWNLLFLGWYKVGMSGDNPDMPSKGYTWSTLPDLNTEIQKTYEDMDLREVRTLFEASYKKLKNIIGKHSEEELFEKKRYHWTGSTSMASYLISAASSHYVWGVKLIRKSLRNT